MTDNMPWRKSSYSGSQADCVEVGQSAGGGDVMIRDTKNRDGGNLAITPAAWSAFLRAL